MRKKLIITVVIIIFIAGLLYFVTREAQQPGEMEKLSLRDSWFLNAHTAGILVAKEKGYFTERNIDLTVNPGGADNPAVKLVAAGANDFGVVAGGEEIILAKDKDIPIIVVAALFQTAPLVFVSKKGSGIKGPQDFIGKKLGVRYGKSSDYIYRALLKKFEIDPASIQETPLGFNYTPFLSGDIDVIPAFSTYEVIIFQNQGIELNIINPGDYGLSSYGYLLITTDELIKNSPDLVQRFVDAYIEGWKYAISHPEEAIDIVLKYNPDLDKSFQLQALQAVIPLMGSKDKLGQMNTERWVATQNVLLDQKIIDETMDVNLFYTTQFLR